MKLINLNLCLIALVACLYLVHATSDESPLPPQISVSELPQAIQAAFQQAKPRVHQAASQLSIALAAGNLCAAEVILEDLARHPHLGAKQQAVVVAGLAAVQEQLRAHHSQANHIRRTSYKASKTSTANESSWKV